MEITIPKKLDTDQAIKFIEYIHSINLLDISSIKFVAQMTFVRTFAMTFVALGLKQFASRAKLKNPDLIISIEVYPDTSGVSYAANMGFFKCISSSILVGNDPGTLGGNQNYLPITQMDLSSVRKKYNSFYEVGEIVQKESMHLASVLSHSQNNLTELFTYIFREMIRNTPEHAKTNTVWFAGQYYSRDNAAEICIIDEGQGIFESLKQNVFYEELIKSNSDALQWAIKPGISQAFSLKEKPRRKSEWDNSGYGLYFITEICKLLKGSFCLVSGDAFLKLGTDGHLTFGKAQFDGTAVKVSISLSEDFKVDNMLKFIRDKGREESKKMKYSFDTPSRSSRSITV